MLCLYLIIRMFAVAHATICIGRRRYIQKEMLIDEGAVLGRHVLMEPTGTAQSVTIVTNDNYQNREKKEGRLLCINNIIYKYIYLYIILFIVSLSCGGDGGAFLKSNYLIVICNNCNARLESAPRALDV